MCTWVGLDAARWMTDYRQTCLIDKEYEELFKATDQLDFKNKLQQNASFVQQRMRPNPPRLCPQCKTKPDQGLLEMYLSEYPSSSTLGPRLEFKP